MGLIRGGLAFIVGILLLISFLAMNLFLTFDLSLDYDNVKPKIVSAIKDIAENKTNLTREIKENFVFAELHCQNNTDFVFAQDEYVFEIPCSVVNEGSDEFIDYGINQAIDETYYKSYECSFFDCLRTEFPFFLISEQAKDSSKNRFYFSLIVSLILITLLFFLTEKKSSLFIVTGSLLAISSLPFTKINTFLSFLDDSFLGFVLVLFSESYNVFLISFTIGIIIIGMGVAMKFWDFGSFISEKFGRQKKEPLATSSKDSRSKKIKTK